MATDKIPLVLAFTPNYFVPAATCLYSILEHSDPQDSFQVICLLTEELPESMKQALVQLGRGRLQLSYKDMKGKLSDIYIDERYTEAASYRLLLPELLLDHDKVLYIDCDVIVRNDLAALYKQTDISDYYLAAVFEASLESQEAYLAQLGLEAGEYFNSGFLLMNLKKLREDEMVPKLLEAAKTPGLQFPDQDVLNQLCKGKVLGLPAYQNSIRTYFLPQYKQDFLRYYSPADWQAVWQHGTIHYTGGKPWDTFTVQFNVWWDYYQDLPRTVKATWKLPKRMYWLYRFYCSGFGKYSLDSIQQCLRRYKYGVS